MRFGFFIDPICSLEKDRISADSHPAYLAAIAQTSGAEMIFAGMNSAKKILSDKDIELMRGMVSADFALFVPFNSNQFDLIKRIKPQSVVITGDNWENAHSPATIEISKDNDYLEVIINDLKSFDITTLLYVTPNVTLTKQLVKLGTGGIVMDTTSYSMSKSDTSAEIEIDLLSEASFAANKLGLYVAAFGGLNYNNVKFVKQIKYLEEIYIGKAIAERALITGLSQAIKDIIAIINRGVAPS